MFIIFNFLKIELDAHSDASAEPVALGQHLCAEVGHVLGEAVLGVEQVGQGEVYAPELVDAVGDVGIEGVDGSLHDVAESVDADCLDAGALDVVEQGDGQG